MNTEENGNFVSVADAADLIGVSRQTVWNYIHAGDIKSEAQMHGLRKFHVIARVDVEDFKRRQMALLADSE